MQTTSAAIGAWNLGTNGLEWTGDARMSIGLVGSATTDEPTAPVADPVASARAWIADPDRRAALGPAIVARTEASILVAERWMREIDAVAATLVQGAVETTQGDLDPEELKRIDGMVEVLATYSLRMRELLDPEAPAPDANSRIGTALDAARTGGLPAFVAAL